MPLKKTTKKKDIREKSELESTPHVIKTSSKPKQVSEQQGPVEDSIKLPNSTITLKSAEEVGVFPKAWMSLFDNVELMYTTTLVYIIYHFATKNEGNFIGSLINYCGQLGLADKIKKVKISRTEPVLSDMEIVALLIDSLLPGRGDDVDKQVENLGKIFYSISKKFPTGYDSAIGFFKTVSNHKKKITRSK